MLINARVVADAGFADHYREAVGAYRAGDAPAFLSAARAARQLRPDSPQAAYLLAAAAAMNDERDEALALLRLLAGQGLLFEPATEPAFAALELERQAPALLERFAAHAMPAGEASSTFRLEEDRFVPEGIAWDGTTRRFLLGSIHQSRILAVDADGRAAEFVAAGKGGLMSVFGMRVEAGTRSLWVATSGLRETRELEPARIGRAGLLEFDLDSGEPRRALWLPDDGAAHVLGDLVLVEGGALTTDSLSGAVLRVSFDSGEYETLLAPGRLVSPQGLVLAADPRFVYLADYRGGLFRLDLDRGELNKLTEGGTSHHGIDGLYRQGQWLLAIQNGVRPNRVVALQLDDGGAAVTQYRVLAAALPEFDEPNLGVVVHGRLHFVANSHWPSFDADGALPGGLTGPLVLSVPIP